MMFKQLYIIAVSFFILCLSACGEKSKEPIVSVNNIVEYHYEVPEQMSDGWPVGSLYDSKFDVDKIEGLINSINEGAYSEIDGILVAQSGSLLLEQYFNGYSQSSLHQTQSAIKSFDSAVVGILLDQQYLYSVDQPIRDLLPELQALDWSDSKEDITLEDLLTMRSGLDCLENKNDVCNSRNLNQSVNWAEFTLSQKMETLPGSVFSYFSGLPLVMHRIVENQTGMSFIDFIDINLLSPLGISNYRFDRSASGEALGAHLLPRDMAKFGQLYLNKGQWEGQQLISSQWIQKSTRASVEDGLWLESFKYGYWWWLYNGEKAGKPFDFIGARGAKGQWIILLPDQELLIVFTGNKDSDAAFEIIEKYFYSAD
jgi:CubicO group peptidase (beta-lactamase class C family)